MRSVVVVFPWMVLADVLKDCLNPPTASICAIMPMFLVRDRSDVYRLPDIDSCLRPANVTRT
jgi:hypothetical protein